MMNEQTGTVRSPGRPRSEKAEKAIIDAAIDMIAEGSGIGELSIEAIAARAGVGKTTIYRRWSNKEDLVVDALASLRPPIPELAGGSVREDVIRYLAVLQREGNNRTTRCFMNIALSEHDRYPHLMERFRATVLRPRREVLRSLLQRGIDRGELRADMDIEVAMAALSGAMMFFTKWHEGDGDLPADLAQRITDSILTGLLAPNTGLGGAVLHGE
ncbi:TetR family transcriptional regulator [Sphaerisporangium melleum]|uniref:TetR family transcriptional regulator n=1 Tax=Sphaerisporangium melleum TaxID=321316 RepID=A0A917VK37_9ACTN|nr:TetR/AcrR family transcriptional regulator [Sphaerisporangium melleum]GGK88551.1 TetR family transcriptional regulator [Sphaerisporangium melleum]GII67696.1 TetR family transcriptional regulator [Sphaerisporangium melleum]